MPTPAAVAARRSWLDGILLSAIALIAYLLLLQESFVNEDARAFVQNSARGDVASVLHPWYADLAVALGAPARWLGASWFKSLEAGSAVATAIAAWCFHAGLSARALGRGRCLAGAALLAATPAVLFFATVVEAPALLLGCTGFAFWALASCSVRPALWKSSGAGVCTAIGAMVHSTGHLCVPVLILTWWPRFTEKRTLHCAAFAAGHGIAFAVTKLQLGPALTPSPSDSAAAVLAFNFAPWWIAFVCAAREYLLPYAPASLLVLWLLGDARHRVNALAVNALALGYVTLSYILLPALWERGTYILPLALPLALLATEALRPRALAALAAVGFVLGLGLIWQHDHRDEEIPASVFLELAGDRPTLFAIGSAAECDDLIRTAPHVPVFNMHQVTQSVTTNAEVEARLIATLGFLEERGMRLCMTATARDALTRARPEIAAWFEERYAFIDAESPAVQAWFLDPRQR